MVEKLSQWLQSDAPGFLVAGALGGVVRWVVLRQTWQAGIGSLIVGSICALYLGPLVRPLLEPLVGPIAPDGDALGFSAFVVGMGGTSLAGGIMDLLAGAVARAKGGQGQGGEK